MSQILNDVNMSKNKYRNRDHMPQGRVGGIGGERYFIFMRNSGGAQNLKDRRTLQEVQKPMSNARRSVTTTLSFKTDSRAGP